MKKYTIVIVLLLLVVLVIWKIGWLAPSSPPNIVLIIIDSLRDDRLG